MSTTPLTLSEIRQLAEECLRRNGADAENAAALAETLTNAERDGSHSHGLFRLPAFVAALRSGKMNGAARPTVEPLATSMLKLCGEADGVEAKCDVPLIPAAIRVHGDNGCASLAHKVGIPELVKSAKENGVAICAFTHIHHMSALWPEVEALAEQGLAAISCTAYMPAVAPAGARQPLFGTNPVAFAWPRPGRPPLVMDMATAAMAKGEVQIAAREGRQLPEGVGLDAKGRPTTNPQAILDGGVLLPFGGYKGSAIALMVELLSAGLLGERFSYEAAAADNGDGGPPRGGQFLLALSPARIAGDGWEAHCEDFFTRLTGLEGVRLPGTRRHANRQSDAPRPIATAWVEKIKQLTEEAPAG